MTDGVCTISIGSEEEDLQIATTSLAIHDLPFSAPIFCDIIFLLLSIP